MRDAVAAITALVHLYAERLDAGDLEGVARLFTEATYGAAGGPVRRGADGILAALRDHVILHDGSPRTKHVISNLTVAVDEEGGSGTARSYFTVLQATSSLLLQPVIAGRYQDRFQLMRGEWCFAARLIHMDLVGDVSQHVRRL